MYNFHDVCLKMLKLVMENYYAKFHTHRYQLSIGAENPYFLILYLTLNFEKVVTVHKGG